MIGTTVAQYRIDAELGRGGMGVVYRAFDLKLHREVALKVLRDADFDDAERRERLLAEARAASPLNHPGIATIFEVGERDGLLFIVMELVEGSSLRETARGKPPRPSDLTRIGAQIAEALDAAHARNVVHGDVKPDNVVISPDGRAKLLDFGVANHAAAQAATATVGNVELPARQPPARLAGTLAYMAPERFRGEANDPRSDLFSLGVLLYELAAGHLPFPGPDAPSIIAQIVSQPAPRLDGADASLPSELTRIVHKLLEKQVDARYQSAREVKVDLANLERDLELGPTLAAAVAGRRAVAVLPFKLLTPSPEDEYLSLALADAIINGLSASDKLLLRPSSAVLRYAKQPADPLVAARELNVEVVVEGSIQKLGPQLRVHVQVWNAADGSTLLSRKHDGDVSVLFELQDRIAEGLFEALGVAAEWNEAPATQNPQAYELFLRAVDRLSLANRWDTRTAIEMLKQVTELDPEFAEAWARLGQGCVMMGFAFEPEGAWVVSAENAIDRALATDPGNVLARVVRGRVLWSPAKGFRNRPALQAIGEALAISPSSHQGLIWRSLIFMHVGLLPEALDGLAEALAMQPDDPFTLNFIGQVHEFMGSYDEAEHYQDRALRIDPTHTFANLFRPTAIVRRGELERAERCIRDSRKLLGDDGMLLATEALIWARRGERTRAERSIAAALGEGKTRAHTHHTWHLAGAAHALLEQPDAAVELLEKAARRGLPNHPLFIGDCHLASLKGHAGFERLMAGLKTECEEYRREFVV